MRRGDLEGAWRVTDLLESERRLAESAGAFRWSPNHLLWNGEPLEGRSVVVYCNHGLGDTLQFIRFVPHLLRLADWVTALVQPPLVPVLRGVPGFGEVLNGWSVGAPLDPSAVQIEVMELAYALRVSQGTLSPMIPYLPHSHIRRKSRLRFPPLERGLKHVGISWEASGWDPTRSIPMENWEVLGSVRNVKYYSLQQGGNLIGHAPFAMEPWSESTRAILDVAHALLRLDLLITVDGMLAHLAGALGRPVWLLLKHEADWRWMSDRTDSPWYPTMRLFRQKSPGNWGDVLEEVAGALME